MKVLSIGDSEMKIIEDALESKIEEENELGEMNDYDFAHLKTTKHLLRDLRGQELVERILGKIWDQYQEFGCLDDDSLEIAEDMGIEEDEFISIMNDLGYEES